MHNQLLKPPLHEARKKSSRKLEKRPKTKGELLKKEFSAWKKTNKSSMSWKTHEEEELQIFLDYSGQEYILRYPDPNVCNLRIFWRRPNIFGILEMNLFMNSSGSGFCLFFRRPG